MNFENEDEDDRLDAVMQLRTDPVRGLFRVVASIERDRRDGDREMEHSGLDLLVDALTSLGIYLDLAEGIARGLVEQDADATHLGMLASVLEKTGRSTEAVELRIQAAAAADSHHDPEIELMVKDRLAKHRK